MTRQSRKKTSLRKRGHSSHRFPDCLRFDLYASRMGDDQLRLEIDVNFATEWVTFEKKRLLFFKDRVRFRFGLRAADLELELHALSSPVPQRNFRRSAPLAENVEHSVATEISSEDNSSLGAGMGIEGATGSASGQLGRSESESRRRTTTDRYSGARFSVQEKGPVDAPKWDFRLHTQGEAMSGAIQQELATLNILDRPYGLTARFVVSRAAIRICEVDNEQYLKASRKKQVVVRQACVEHIHSRAQDYFSKVELHDE